MRAARCPGPRMTLRVFGRTNETGRKSSRERRPIKRRCRAPKRLRTAETPSRFADTPRHAWLPSESAG
ncbi:hypothetical protein MRX96_046480 [Rhipicephalus microplus]